MPCVDSWQEVLAQSGHVLRNIPGQLILKCQIKSPFPFLQVLIYTRLSLTAEGVFKATLGDWQVHLIKVHDLLKNISEA